MKKTICIFLFLFAILTISKAQEVIKVGAFNYYPVIFKDTDGVIKGFYVDALTEFGKKENLQFVYVYGTWAEGLERIKTGEVDLLTSVAITEDRLKFLDYTSTPILTVWSEVYIRPKSEIDGIMDLEGKIIAVMKNDFNATQFKQYTQKLGVNCQYVEYADFDEVFKLIANGEVDAGIVNNIYGAAKSSEYKLITSGIVFNPFDIFFTVKKGSNQELLKLLNTTLHSWKHDGNSVLNSTRQKWSHGNVGFIEIFPRWFQKAIFSTLLLISLLTVFIVMLRYQVRRATKKVKASEERFRLAMKASNDGLFDWNLETNEIYYSPGWKKMLGYEDHELPNDFSVWEDYTEPEDVKKTMELIEKLKLKQIDRFVIEFKTRHKKGHWVDVLSRGEAFFNNQGKAVRIVGTHVDITERKRTEKELILAKEKAEESEMALKHSHDLMQYIIEHNHSAIAIHDKNLRYIYVSQKYLKDYKIEDKNIIGKHHYEVLPDIPQKWRDVHKKALEGIVSSAEEDSYPKDDGTIEWTRWECRPWYENGNSIGGFIIYTELITERKNMEFALKAAKEKTEESELQLKEAQRVSRLGSYSWDLSTGLWNSSDVLNEIFGIDESYNRSLQGWVDIIHNDWKEIMNSYVTHEVLGKLQRFDKEYKITRISEGIDTWVHGQGELILDEKGNPVKMYGTIQDINRRKLAEEAIIENEQKLNALFSSMTEMVALHEMVFDEKGNPVNYRIIDCNYAYTQITGIKKEDALGKLANNVYGTDTPPYLKEFGNVAITGEPYAYTTYFAPMDKHFSISVVSPKKNQFATITTDITAMKQIQEVISAKNKELENYLYVSSHDLRSPLVNIQGFSQRLQKQLNSINSLLNDCNLEPEIKTNLSQISNKAIPETLNYIFTSVTKMDTLINSLLQISRVGRVKMEIKKVDINQLIKNIIDQLNYQLTEISAKVIFEKLPDCYGDENTLNQLFSNILDNAIKYRSPDAPLTIRIEGKTIYSKAIYSIKDNGIGIAPKYLNKIWDVFYRVDPTIKESGEGIGLSLAKRIVEKHKGKIWVESEEGVGTTFYVELQTIKFEE